MDIMGWANKGARYSQQMKSAPVEVIIRIFSFICEYDPAQPDSRVSPLFLGRICRSWRLMAWSDPILWSVIDLAWKGRTKSPHLKVEVLEEWLNRSKSAPVSIYLTVKFNYRYHNPPQRVFDLIAAHLWHIRLLELPLLRPWEFDMAQMRKKLSASQSLHFKEPSEITTGALSQHPASVDHVRVQFWSPFNEGDAWSQLSYAQMTGGYENCYLTLHELASSIERVWLQVTVPHMPPEDGRLPPTGLSPITQPTLRLDHIRSFELYAPPNVNTVQIISLLSHLHLPNLKRAAFTFREFPFTKEVKIWGNRLEHLTICYPKLPTVQDIAWINSPSLQHLVVNLAYIFQPDVLAVLDTFLYHFQWEDGILPSLHTLEIIDNYRPRIVIPALTSLKLSKWKRHLSKLRERHRAKFPLRRIIVVTGGTTVDIR